MSEHADAIIDRYLRRMPGAETAYLHDPTYHAQIKFMRSVFVAVDMAMDDEQIAESTRLRVLRAVMYGAPDVDAADGRIDVMRKAAENLARCECPLVYGSVPGGKPEFRRGDPAGCPVHGNCKLRLRGSGREGETGVSDDLTTWLRERLDEDERDVDEVHSIGCSWYAEDGECDCEWPRRRADVAAKRAILAIIEHQLIGDPVHGLTAQDMVRLLAAPYANMPGYRREWRP